MSRTGPCCAHNVKDQWWLWSASGIAIYCILLLCLAQSPLASMGVRMKFRPSSSFTCFRNSQRRQSINFLAWFPCTFPPQRVPATAQQNLPQCLPLLTPSKCSLGNAAGHAPSSSASSPAGCPPHFIASQQFLLTIRGHLHIASRSMTASMQSVGPPADRPSIGLRTPWPPRLSTCM